MGERGGQATLPGAAPTTDLDPIARTFFLGPLKAGCAKLSAWYTFDVWKRQWRFSDPRNDAARAKVGVDEDWLLGWGFSMVYAREVWLQSPFPDKRIGEDFDF